MVKNSIYTGLYLGLVGMISVSACFGMENGENKYTNTNPFSVSSDVALRALTDGKDTIEPHERKEILVDYSDKDISEGAEFFDSKNSVELLKLLEKDFSNSERYAQVAFIQNSLKPLLKERPEFFLSTMIYATLGAGYYLKQTKEIINQQAIRGKKIVQRQDASRQTHFREKVNQETQTESIEKKVIKLQPVSVITKTHQETQTDPIQKENAQNKADEKSWYQRPFLFGLSVAIPTALFTGFATWIASTKYSHCSWNCPLLKSSIFHALSGMWIH